MIKNIRATVTFPVSGEVLNVDFSPPPGVTAVVGPNGSGKTFTGSECARWLLFGKAALRGAADDYKTLVGKGEFTIAGADYTIDRGTKKEQIADAAGKVLAVGAKAVTAKVEEIFGYGLAVFDICNASVQKDADSFGKMLPAARKRMLDRVCGLSSNEAIEKECREKARDYRTSAEALTRTLRQPEPVDRPVDYQNSSDLIDELARVRDLRDKADRITATMRPAFEPQLPDAPRPYDGEVHKLAAEQAACDLNAAERRRLKAILSETQLFDIELSEEKLVLAEQRNIAHAEIIRRGMRPSIPMKELVKLQDAWRDYNFASRQSDVNAQCPKCKHVFRIGGELPEKPDQPEVLVGKEFRAHEAWAAGEVSIPDGPDMTPSEIGEARAMRGARERHDRAGEMLSDLAILPSRTKELEAARTATAEWAAYDKGMERAKVQLAANAAAEKALRELGDLPPLDAADKLNDKLHEARTYEAAAKRFEADTVEFTNRSAEIKADMLMAEEFGKGAKALSEARTELKSVLTPLLSTVASSLLFEMSNGELKSVAVDEDMEITIDGRRIETLSGAGVTVANLALRIGLGQVLVKNTFPVFLGDEMDSDADAVRREATLSAMRALRSRLKQIILITHREVEDVDMVLNLAK